MQPEDELLFICTRQHFEKIHQQEALQVVNNHAMRWDRIFHTADNHGVSPLIHVNLRKAPEISPLLPPEIARRFERSAYRNSIRSEEKARRIEASLKFLNRRGIQVMLIKGEALNLLVYERPWYTISADTDMILAPKPEALAKGLRKEIGHFHFQSGIEYDFYKHHDIDMNETIPVEFNEIWRDARKVQFRGEAVYVMAPEDLLITTCINGCRKRFFRLKSLADIAEITRCIHVLNWDTVIRKAYRYDCAAIVYTALHVTNQTLGIDVPVSVWQALAPASIRRRVIRLLTEVILRSTRLYDLYPFTGLRVSGRAVNRTLLLTYSAYQPYQAWHKLRLLVSREA